MQTNDLIDDHRCFACGKQNPIGLQLDFHLQPPDRITAKFIPDPLHQGYAGVTHGGIIATVLDEAMARIMCDQGQYVVTAMLEMRFRKPVPTGVEVTIEARRTETRRKHHYCESTLALPDGTIAAEASGVYVA